MVQTTEAYRYRQNCPPATASQYPVALVPGQFQENYRQYTAAELLYVLLPGFNGIVPIPNAK